MVNNILANAVSAAGPKKGGTLTMGLGGGGSDNALDPALVTDPFSIMYMMTAGDRLTDISPNGEVMMRMAEKISASPDAMVWTFTLRKGMTSHSGAPGTAADVVATIKRHSDKESQSGAAGIMTGIASVKASGDNVIVFTMKSANADFPALMSDYHLVIQPGGGKENPNAGVFSGPYSIKTFEPGVRVVLEKFSNYWDDSRGHVDTIEMLVINDNCPQRGIAIGSGSDD